MRFSSAKSKSRHQRKRGLQLESLERREVFSGVAEVLADAADEFQRPVVALELLNTTRVEAASESTDRVLANSPSASLVRGEVNFGGDVDQVQFHAVRGTRYVLETAAGTLRDTTLTLRDPLGRVVAFDDDGGDRLASRIAFTANYDGQYTVSVGAYGSWQTGSYDLSIAQDHASVWVASALEAHDADLVAFEAMAHEAYTFETQLGTLSDTVLRLYDSNGRQLAFNDDGGAGLASRIEWTAPGDGLYFLGVEAYSGYQTGSYQVEVSQQLNPDEQGTALRALSGALSDIVLGGGGDNVAAPQPITIPRGGGSDVATPQPITIPRGGSQVASPQPITIPRGAGSVASPQPITIPRGGGSVATPQPITIPRGGSSVASPQPITIPRGGGGSVASPQPITIPGGGRGVVPLPPPVPSHVAAVHNAMADLDYPIELYIQW